MLKDKGSRAILILGCLLSVVLFSGQKNSQNHEETLSALKSKPSFCASRSISSEEPSPDREENDEDQKLLQVCQNQQRINSLKKDIEELEVERERVLSTIEEAIAKQESELTKKERTRHQHALMSKYQYPYPMLNSLQAQYNQTPTFMNVYSPFHDHSNDKNMNYLKVAMSQRLAMKLRASQSWSPEWNSSGHMTNPIYGTPQAWQNLEDMHRLPLSSGFMMRNPGSLQSPSLPLY
jgi:hypothetical protein